MPPGVLLRGFVAMLVAVVMGVALLWACFEHTGLAFVLKYSASGKNVSDGIIKYHCPPCTDRSDVFSNQRTQAPLSPNMTTNLTSGNSSSRESQTKTSNDFNAHNQRLKKIGLESTQLHEFKSPYIIDPVIYDNTTIHRVPGVRETKVISCFNCPRWFTEDKAGRYSLNRDFKKCPYSECVFDPVGTRRSEAALVLFFPGPKQKPVKKPGQIWAFCSWESPANFGVPSRYHGQPRDYGYLE